MSEADKADENAFCFESKKDRLAQRQSGDWVITFTVSPLDMPSGLLTAAMGTRFQIAAVEVTDDETAVQQPPEAHQKPRKRESQICGALCHQVPFQKFMEERYAAAAQELRGGSKAFVPGSDMAAYLVRGACKIGSRALLDEPDLYCEARDIWHNLKTDYDCWMKG